jgi:hypothetical protein
MIEVKRTMALSVVRLPAAALATVVGVAMLAPAPAAAQGFFDFLFGGRPSYEQQRPVVAYAPDPGYGWPDETPRPARPKHRTLDDYVFTGKPEKKAPPPVGDGPLGAFLNDPTLRAGDVVVTPNGLMVFRGDGGGYHANRDFVALAKASSLSGAERRTLASIEKANRLAPTIETASLQPQAGERLEKQARNDTPVRHRH